MKKIILLLFTVFMLQLHFTSAALAFGSDRIKVGEQLCNGCLLQSSNNTYYIQIWRGNLELWKRFPRPETLLWTKQTNDKWGNHYLKIDYYSGKLVLSRANGDPAWYSDNAAWSNIHYQGKPPANLRGDILIMQDDGNLVLYNTTDLNQGWYPVWASDTGVGGP
ncbi:MULTISPECIES: hypothetical protein [Brevibacillus]|uniref:hypothetical protein n=1 Tax=Brevibacillus TaxID=55080 RepID=UPI001C8D5235|nr:MULTISPECIES: hypothetical protein [Brevibacillus]MBY0088449.1 hypothetical protein [Brevibacillus brevis]MCE0450821.1 hypothetical protein [Brevibacillus sp. AF8]